MIDTIATLFTYFAMTLVCLFPGLIASVRKHRNAVPIYVLAVILGWTGIGWALALVWSFTANTEV